MTSKKNTKTPKDVSDAIIYQAKNGAIELRGDFSNETVWATQAQVAQVFGVSVPTINEHLKNIYKTKELAKDSTIRKFRIVQKEGNRKEQMTALVTQILK